MTDSIELRDQWHRLMATAMVSDPPPMVARGLRPDPKDILKPGGYVRYVERDLGRSWMDT